MAWPGPRLLSQPCEYTAGQGGIAQEQEVSKVLQRPLEVWNSGLHTDPSGTVGT